MFEEFRQEEGREPTVWLDEIVIDQSSLDDEAMMCLPANIMSCNKVMVLCGDTYIDRLWCIWCVLGLPWHRFKTVTIQSLC